MKRLCRLSARQGAELEVGLTRPGGELRTREEGEEMPRMDPRFCTGDLVDGAAI